VAEEKLNLTMLSPRGFKRARLKLVYQITGERAPASMEHAQSFFSAENAIDTEVFTYFLFSYRL